MTRYTPYQKTSLERRTPPQRALNEERERIHAVATEAGIAQQDLLKALASLPVTEFLDQRRTLCKALLDEDARRIRQRQSGAFSRGARVS